MSGVPLSQIPNAPWVQSEPPLSGLKAPTFYSTGVAQTLLTPPINPPPPFNPQPASALPDYLQEIWARYAAPTNIPSSSKGDSSFDPETPLSAASASPIAFDPEKPPLIPLQVLPAEEKNEEISPPEQDGQKSGIDIAEGPTAFDLNGPTQPSRDKQGIIIDPFAEGVDLPKIVPERLSGVPAMDHDGSPTAYMPGDRGSEKLSYGHVGEDYFGYIPTVMNDEGGYVSKTSWRHGPKNLQSSYVDSRRVPYITCHKAILTEADGWAILSKLRIERPGRRLGRWLPMVAESAPRISKYPLPQRDNWG